MRNHLKCRAYFPPASDDDGCSPSGSGDALAWLLPLALAAFALRRRSAMA